MSGDDNFPVILVSAVDAAAASAIITELLDDGDSPPQCNGVSHSDEEAEDAGSLAPVWRLNNKYYSATVRLRALPDGEAPRAGDDVQAHLIYLTEDECSDSSACARRWKAAAAGARGAVRLVAARAAHEPPHLLEWARARRYELVALLEQPEDNEPFSEARGVARVREALHAHVWPGLRRAGAARPPAPAGSSGSSSADSSDSEWGSWRRGADTDGGGEEGGEAGAVRRAEQFADALGLLAARPRHDDDDDTTRRLHAEQLVAAFCRALGHDLPTGTDADDPH